MAGAPSVVIEESFCNGILFSTAKLLNNRKISLPCARPFSKRSFKNVLL
jgi:hypothetical protein